MQAALNSGKDYGDTWNRVYSRERIHAINDFVVQNPEKAQVYASKWDAFVNKFPEVSGMNNAQWQSWLDEHPDTPNLIREYRDIARAVEYFNRKKEMEMVQSNLRETEYEISKIRKSLGISEQDETETGTPLAQS